MRTRALLTVAVTILVALSGCSALPVVGGDGGAGGPTGQVATIQDRSMDAAATVSTYEFRMNLTASTDTRTVEGEAEGVVNRDTRRMRMELSLMGQDVLQYVDGDTMYQRTNGIWRTRNVSDRNLWEGGTVLQNQQELMESSNVQLDGTTTIDGTEVYVIRIDPSDQALRELLRQQSTTAQLSPSDIQEVHLTQYVRTDDHMPKGSHVELTASRNGQTVTVDVTYILENFGTDVSITIPAEARDGISGAS